VEVARAAPAYAQVFPTLRCNRACGFCFNRHLAPAGDMQLATFAAVLDRAGAAGVRAVDLLGGEPTLHPALGDMVRAAAARGVRVTLSTNGDGGLDLLGELEDELGRDAFRAGVSVNEGEAPARLAAWIASRSPMVKSVCRRGGALPRLLAEHLARPGTEGYLIYLDALVAGDLDRTVAYPEFLELLVRLRRRHPGLAGVACGGFVPDLKVSPELAGARCPAGTTKLSVLPDGSAYPCYLLFGRPEFRLGNLATEPFERIWSHPALGFFRRFRGNPCRRTTCAHHAACRGGCPAVSLLVAGDLAGPDPRCGRGTPQAVPVSEGA